MKQPKVFCGDDGPIGPTAAIPTATFTVRPLLKLLLVWLAAGIIPFALQIRSYIKFVRPHKISQRLLVPPGVSKETENLLDVCPVIGMILSESWWNIEATHYYTGDNGRICHFVVPQYNTHGNYFIGSLQASPYYTTPSNCAADSYQYEQYFYHGSIGFYSFYEGQKGTYCANDNFVYIVATGLGTFDMNGSILAEDTGTDDSRKSFWYAIIGAGWIGYRALVLRRSFISCKNFGRRCEQMGEDLTRKQAVVFVQENLRLSAHGATNYHRIALLYLLIEGIMSDLFLIVATTGLGTKIQYVSMGYNLSGLMLLVFETIESATCLREKWRLFFKRLLFNYETAFLGEILSSALQQYFLTGLNRSSLKKSRPTALAVSYYIWSLFGHAFFVVGVAVFVVLVRALWSAGYVWREHRSWAVFTDPCCMDTTLKLRNKMVMLGAYRCDNGRLFYNAFALKAFGLLKVQEEDGAECLVMHKLYWFAAPRNNLITIGVVSGQRVEPCSERPCLGVVRFWDRRLGGSADDTGSSIQVKTKPACSGPVQVQAHPPQLTP